MLKKVEPAKKKELMHLKEVDKKEAFKFLKCRALKRDHFVKKTFSNSKKVLW